MNTLSIVTSVFNSERTIQEFVKRACATAEKNFRHHFEIIIVNDGSADQTLSILRSICARNQKCLVLNLSRNFGHHAALLCGLEQAKGEYVFLIDSDLEEAPELLSEFFREMKIKNADTVYGVQKGRRKGDLFERISGAVFYRIFGWLCPLRYEANQLTARLMRRCYLTEILKYRENQFDLWGFFSLAGFKQIPFASVKTHKKSSTYTLGKKISMACAMIISLSEKPLVFIFLFGLAVTFLSCGVVVYLVTRRLLVPDMPLGYATIASSIWLIGGIVILSIGTVGLYLSKVFLEVKKRPRYHISEIIGCLKAGKVKEGANRLVS